MRGSLKVVTTPWAYQDTTPKAQTPVKEHREGCYSDMCIDSDVTVQLLGACSNHTTLKTAHEFNTHDAVYL